MYVCKKLIYTAQLYADNASRRNNLGQMHCTCLCC